MSSTLVLEPTAESIGKGSSETGVLVPRLPGAAGRRVALLAVHHVRVGERIYTGGAEKYIQLVIRSLLDAGARVHVGYSGTSIYDELLEAYHPRDFTVEQTGWINEALSGDARLRISTIRQRLRWLRATRADTVFAVQQGGGGSFAASLIAARLLGLRVVSSMRQLPAALPAPSRSKWLGIIPSPQLWRRRLIWRKRIPAFCAHALIYNSHNVMAAYQETYGFPASRAYVIFNGELEEAARPSTDAAETPIRIGTVGRVTEAKGADVLLDAFRIVARRHPDARLTYFGDGELIPKLSAQAAAIGLNDRVSFRGYVPSRSDIYSSIDICVQPSRRESMSNSVVEAQTHGIPCIVSDVGGMRETVAHGESGFVVPPEDPTACARAICDLLSDRQRYQRFSRNAAERSRREFNLRDLMTRTVRVILGI